MIVGSIACLFRGQNTAFVWSNVSLFFGFFCAWKTTFESRRDHAYFNPSHVLMSIMVADHPSSLLYITINITDCCYSFYGKCFSNVWVAVGELLSRKIYCRRPFDVRAREKLACLLCSARMNTTSTTVVLYLLSLPPPFLHSTQASKVHPPPRAPTNTVRYTLYCIYCGIVE